MKNKLRAFWIPAITLSSIAIGWLCAKPAFAGDVLRQASPQADGWTDGHPRIALMPANVSETAAPVISAIADNSASFPDQLVPAYAQFRIDFQLQTSAENLQLPYDPAPPPGVQPGLGVSVNALFTPDNWQTTFSIPAFFFQDFEVRYVNNREWYYPTGVDRWQVRFAPPTPGQWAFKLQAQDSGGQAESPEFTFRVSPSTNPGFIRVSQADPRYFEFQNGRYFPALGYNMNFNHLSWDNPVLGNEAHLATMAENGIQLVRVWLSQWGIYTASWGSWNAIDPDLHGQYIPWTGITFSDSYPGSEVAMKLDAAQNPCMFLGFMKASPAVRRNTEYRLRIRYKSVSLSGPRLSGQPYGFLAKTGGWLWGPGEQCDEPASGVPLTPYLDTPGTGWQIIETSFTTGNYDFLPNLYLALENLDAGSVYIDRIWLEENLGGGAFGPNIIDKPWMAQHLYMSQRNSFAFDRMLELAEAHGIYLRPVILEKNDFVFNHIGPDGDFTWTGSNANFYGAGRQVTKVRWLQQAWWRYLQARWGYSTSIHSWELLNEGDPASAQHFILADELGAFMKKFAPNDHLVSTSFWHSFPRDNFWANPAYPNIDFADIHEYIPQSSPDFEDAAQATASKSMQYGALQPGGAGKPVIRGETGFVLQGSEPPTEALSADTGGIWLHNFIWGGINAGGLIESYWYETPHIYQASPGGQASLDHRWHFGVFHNFIRRNPLNNGNYRPIEASTPDSRLRILGQIDPVGRQAHLWIQNRGHTWRNVVDGAPIAAISTSITIEGFKPGGHYLVQWWDTYQSDPARQVRNTQDLIARSDGSLILVVDGLVTDTAVRIFGGEQLYLPCLRR